IGPDPRNFNQRVSLGRNDLLIRTFPKDHNCIEVYGVPTKTGAIKINISGGIYGSMIAPASYFSKDYTLNIVKP
ncbi:hypothetical protein OGW13_02710, partial [Citrobacter sp. Ca225]|nr:hypothetical protein [Citrobacter sp. Ca225]